MGLKDLFKRKNKDEKDPMSPENITSHEPTAVKRDKSKEDPEISQDPV
ncbi:MAG TPA: hypothetical protein VF884_07255 [Nitrososphaeraceae archaeon]